MRTDTNAGIDTTAPALNHLNTTLGLQAGQGSRAGPKSRNEDCIGLRIPDGALLTTKGIAMVIADGVSAAEGGQEAAHSAVTGFLSDYYSTPDTWSTTRSVEQVMRALNNWLYGRNLNHHHHQLTYLTTLTAVIVKSRVAHIFHVGDSRLWLFRAGELISLTRDHAAVTRAGSHLTRAMGMDHGIDIDYRQWPLEEGDVLCSTTDGVHDWVPETRMIELLTHHGQSPQTFCDRLLAQTEASGSTDNQSVQALYFEKLSAPSPESAYLLLTEKAFLPPLDPGHILDGMRVEKELYASERSQVYLVKDEASGRRMVMKTPSMNHQDDAAYLERFALEQWMGSRLNNPHVVRVLPQPEGSSFLYYLTEFLDGPSLEEAIQTRAPFEVSDALMILEDMIRGLRAFHRRDMLHQDLKPGNVMLCERGAVLVDFGSATARGITELVSPVARDIAQGTARYSAPELHAGRAATGASEQFSLGVMLYEMLTGHHPYGEAYEVHARQPRCLRYVPAAHHNALIPAWLDATVARAVDLKPEQRFPALSNWLTDLKNPKVAAKSPAGQGQSASNMHRWWPWLFWASALVNGGLLWLLWR